MTASCVQVIAGLVVGCFLVASYYGYIYNYDSESGVCDERTITTTMKVFMWSTEMTFNLVVPLVTIVLNVLVIRSLLRSRRARRQELACTTVPQHSEKTSKTATTLMLLSISFFNVATTLPMTIVYLAHPFFYRGDDHMTDEEVLFSPVRLLSFCNAVTYGQHAAVAC